MRGTILGLPGKEYSIYPAPKIKTGKTNEPVLGADRVGKKRAGRVTITTPEDCSNNLPHTNKLFILKQLVKRKS